MKKISLLIVPLVLVGFTGGIFAQEITEEPAPLIPEVLPELPNPGLKPGDFFYFLDIWGEAIREFFTFRAESKALLQTERALERIAEVKALLETDGLEAPGLVVAQEKIQENMAKAARILEQQKARGIEVSLLAKKLDGEFDVRQTLLKGAFEIAKENLRAQKKVLRAQIREARLAGDFEKIRELRDALVNIKDQKDRMDIRKDLLEKTLEAEEERIKAGMEAKEKEIEALAEEAEDLFVQRERGLERAFKQRERALEVQEKALEIQLRQAILIGDTALAEQIRAKLTDLELEEESIKTEEDVLKERLEQKKGKMKRVVVMEERAAEQIEEAREKLLEVKGEMVELVEVPPAVSELVSGAESKLALAEQAFVEEKYGRAFGQAMAVEMLARNVRRMLEEKGEVVEKLEELKEKLEEASSAEEVLREVQGRLERAPVERREKIKKEIEEARKQHQERLKEIEKERKEVERAKERIRERTKKETEKEEYYGFSTYGPCKINNDCHISGCNKEICQSREEDPLVSICVLPDKSTPLQLDYACKCLTEKCQWLK